MARLRKFTLELINEDGRRYAIDRQIDPAMVSHSRLPKIRFMIGFDTITLDRPMFGEMLRQLQMAEVAGAEYPEDFEDLAKAGYGLA